MKRDYESRMFVCYFVVLCLCLKIQLGADHLTLGGGGVDDFWSASFFFLATWWAGYLFLSKFSAGYFFFPLHFSAGFFFLKKVSCVYIYRMYLHLHCGYCCNSSIWSCKALKCCKLYKIMLYKNMFSESHSLHSFNITS